NKHSIFLASLAVSANTLLEIAVMKNKLSRVSFIIFISIMIETVLQVIFFLDSVVESPSICC
ncbi:hypothetical protein, partial [Acinetobacter johnsonii]|uniref:hypothetical protein n=1 Tax=Acinetobacter johnsonii TaxID=40214 RepID=UPI00244952EB